MSEVTLKFDDRVAVVTGAAGNIGLATCRMFCEAGVKIAATDISVETVESCIAPLKERGFDIRAYAQDVTDREAVRETFGRILADFGKIELFAGLVLLTVFHACRLDGHKQIRIIVLVDEHLMLGASLEHTVDQLVFLDMVPRRPDIFFTDSPLMTTEHAFDDRGEALPP